MTIHKERAARAALEFLSTLRSTAEDQEAFDHSIQALQTLLDEYNGFDTSLVLIHRLSNHALEADAGLREQNAEISLRLAKALSTLTDINFASHPENAVSGPPHPDMVSLDLDNP